jgi:dTDP-4-amino-4,6-dideoxygalactose transaminase
MKFIDLEAQQARVRDLMEKSIQQVLDHQQFIMGPEIGRLEETLARYVGSPHAVGCGSGTDALLLALMAFDVGPGDAVLTTPFTFIATAEVIALLGATPVFVDIEPETFNLDPEALAETIQALQSGKPGSVPSAGGRRPPVPKGVIAVDLFGIPADYERITAVAEDAGLFVLEDAAQSFGAARHGRRCGSFGAVAATSFFPAKPLGCYGDGGMCFTADADLAGRMQSIRVHGQGKDRYEHLRIGINGRLDTLQAAVLLAKFTIFSDEIERRGAVARNYGRLLRERSIPLRTPVVPEGVTPAWAQYSVLAEDSTHRDRCREALHAAGIPTAVYYPVPLHLQPAFAFLEYRKGRFPVSEETAARIFSLPMHPYLSEEDQQRIAEVLAAV